MSILRSFSLNPTKSFLCTQVFVSRNVLSSQKCLYWEEKKINPKSSRRRQILPFTSVPLGSRKTDLVTVQNSFGFSTSSPVNASFITSLIKFPLAAQFVERSPGGVQPFLKLMRIDRPIGSWLLFWPGSWSIAMAASAGHLPDPLLLAIFGTGSVIMRGAGCTINDMWDRNIDSKVARTRTRPIASGQLGMFDALVFLSGQLGLGLLILLQLNWYSVLLGASSLGLIVLYPLMKRFTYWPQLVLGLTFNWGVFLGWAAVQGSCNWHVCVPMYVAAISWTIMYDTIYAHQDKTDDVIIGMKSTALKFGENTKQWLTGFGSVMIANLILAGHFCEQTWPYYASVGLIGLHVAQQISTLNIDNPEDCGKKFVSNSNVGLLLFLGIVLGNLLKENKPIESNQFL